MILQLAIAATAIAASKPIQIACVGDSITAGYLASNQSMTYPGELQTMLDAKYGKDSYNVHNFGAGGATVQKGADSPYWKRTQFTQFVNGTYDVIIIMLGTNDAKDPGNGGAPNWPDNCTAPYPSPSNCTVMKDYISLIELAKTKGRGAWKGKKSNADQSEHQSDDAHEPVVVIMRPPPLWRDSDYGMNQTILNTVMPPLVPAISSLAKLSYPPIDVYSALGGTPDWKTTYPVCGCQKKPAAASGAAGAGASAGAGAGAGEARGIEASIAADVPQDVSIDAFNFTATQGFLPMGGDFAVGNYTYKEAVEACGKAKDCAAFTFKSNGTSTPTSAVHMYLKQCNNGLHKVDGWWSWLKPPSEVPESKEPSACALFCDAQSCDGCHPNNNGYRVLAHTVFDFVTSVHHVH